VGFHWSNVGFFLGVVGNLRFNRDVFNSLMNFLNGLLLHVSLLNISSYIFYLSLNGIVVGTCSGNRDSFSMNNLVIFNALGLYWDLVNPFNFLIFNVLFFIGNIFYSAFSGGSLLMMTVDFRNNGSGISGSNSCIGGWLIGIG